MNILSVENISKSYGERLLFDDTSFGISEGDKIGLVGINGTGKTTLLKVIAGMENSDTGRVIISNNVTIGYLPQNVDFYDDVSIIEQVFNGTSPVFKLLKEYEAVVEKINSNRDDLSLQKKLASLSERIDASGGWQVENEAKSILTKLGITEFNAPVMKLSGGQKKRVAIAAALIDDAELLILDEPTNHLDSIAIEWLEQYLNKRKGALLMVTHDRYFLDRVTNRIIELDNGKLYSYSGNYSIFLEKKIERQENEKSTEEKRQNLMRKELAWIKRGAKARTTKQKARIQRFENLCEDNTDTSSEKVDITVGSSRLGKKIIELSNISKEFEGTKYIDKFSYVLQKYDRVGIVGLNGCGKSTLLNIICGRLEPDSGKVETGETVKIGYYSQETEYINNDSRVIDYIREEAEYIRNSEGELISASKMLEKFLFSPEAQWKPVLKLSGGEKRRLYLLRVLMSSPNILILDEPTNDLDIETLSILEDYVEEFPGAVITVSHDRYFLNKIANKIFAFEGSGMIKQYTGNYFDYRQSEMDELARLAEPVKKAEASKDKSDNENNKKNKPLKFTYKEQKEYEGIDSVIEETENEIKGLNQRINSAGSDFMQLQELLSKKEELDEKLQTLMDRWTYLNELAEKIDNDK
jgi:ABC transport system ATP-binding/permease protein